MSDEHDQKALARYAKEVYHPRFESYSFGDRCHARVWRGNHHTQCSRKGKLKEHGHMWCKQHAPSTRLAKYKELWKKERKWNDSLTHQAKINGARNDVVKSTRKFVHGQGSIVDVINAVEKLERLENEKEQENET